MKKYLTKKWLAPVVGIGVAAGIAVGAFAYFTASGSGTGSASVGTSSGIQLTNDTVGPLYPGGAATPVTVHVHNPGSGTQHVGTITGTVADNGGCQGTWFTVAPVTYNQDIAGGTDGPDATSSITFAESGTNQDACKGLSLTITWTSN